MKPLNRLKVNKPKQGNRVRITYPVGTGLVINLGVAIHGPIDREVKEDFATAFEAIILEVKEKHPSPPGITIKGMPAALGEEARRIASQHFQVAILLAA